MQTKIRYECQHLTCRMLCHTGEISLDKNKFLMFCQNNTEPGCFTSPSSVCKIGHIQTFKILETKEEPKKEESKKEESKKEPKKEESKKEEPKKEVIVSLNDFLDLKGRVEKLEEQLVNKTKGTKVSRKEE